MNTINETIDKLFRELTPISLPGEGVTRPAFSPEEQAAHDIMARFASGLGMKVETDGAGNHYMTLRGHSRDHPGLVVGSHLDSVPSGGVYDGAAGVIAGLAVAADLLDRREVPPLNLTVMAIRAEESVWFPVSYLGSRAALGRLEPKSLEICRSDTGRSLAEHLLEAGFDPDFIRKGRAHLTPDRVAAYIEVHIEQGPLLHDENIPVGIVSAIRGGLRFRNAKILGAWAHSGATPRRLRRDVAFALSDFMSRVEEMWDEIEEQGEDFVATFGMVNTDATQHAFSKVPGRIDFCLDTRSISSETLDRLQDKLPKMAEEVAKKRRVRIELGESSSSRPAAMDATILEHLANAAEVLDLKHRVLPSGAGHDAAAFAQAGIPAGMIFVRNENGSHNADEAMDHADLALAASLLRKAIMDWPVATGAEGT
jgi:N-carbamoyl-L-amino-acid hydrolase